MSYCRGCIAFEFQCPCYPADRRIGESSAEDHFVPGPRRASCSGELRFHQQDGPHAGKEESLPASRTLRPWFRLQRSGCQTGSEGQGLQVGDPVLGSIGRGGCDSEYLVVKGFPDKIAARGRVPATEASTLGIAFLTAYESLILSGDIQRHHGKWIYIAGAGGASGILPSRWQRSMGSRLLVPPASRRRLTFCIDCMLITSLTIPGRTWWMKSSN